MTSVMALSSWRIKDRERLDYVGDGVQPLMHLGHQVGDFQIFSSSVDLANGNGEVVGEFPCLC